MKCTFLQKKNFLKTLVLTNLSLPSFWNCIDMLTLAVLSQTLLLINVPSAVMTSLLPLTCFLVGAVIIHMCLSAMIKSTSFLFKNHRQKSPGAEGKSALS